MISTKLYIVASENSVNFMSNGLHLNLFFHDFSWMLTRTGKRRCRPEFSTARNIWILSVSNKARHARVDSQTSVTISTRYLNSVCYVRGRRARNGYVKEKLTFRCLFLVVYTLIEDSSITFLMLNYFKKVLLAH